MFLNELLPPTSFELSTSFIEIVYNLDVLTKHNILNFTIIFTNIKNKIYEEIQPPPRTLYPCASRL
jgi:hypothetical protein